MNDAPDSALPVQKPSELAAIDLGSNSFHMVVGQLRDGEFKPLDIMSEKVQLAAGLDADKRLSEAAQLRGLECLARFAQRVRDLPRQSVRIVGTNALREAVNRREFLERAEEVLGTPLEVISGREEARLIYLGVSQSLPPVDGRRLVIDIGGGSTEFIVGRGVAPRELESLEMGCVSFTQRFFASGDISEEAFQKATYAALRELLSIQKRYRRLGWSHCVGSSGTIKAIRNACVSLGYTEERISAQALHKLRQRILGYRRVDEITEVKLERRPVLPAGLAILCAAFDSLGIDEMEYSDGALREGLLYEMVGRLHHEDIRERSLDALTRRYHVDRHQAERVERTALRALDQLQAPWQLDQPHQRQMLRWAAATHEVGLSLSHSGYHKHSAYLLQYSDMAGFTDLDRLQLALLVRSHRRKIPKDEFKLLPKSKQETCRRLTVLLRLAALLHRNRSSARLPEFRLEFAAKRLYLSFPRGWLDNHPLTKADLEQEADYLKAFNLKLQVA
ncbi:exopolyphosphatase [Marinobacterium nitratireducens]|uniref:Exopolyphosphatase n=1 Tax=Marinobacterium nitratireducens TaxID=518897 RepID=A0A917ZP77_9GAMM|nr:Ppx/GppA phosphatase family protein [Marinobacterium nitratireducens]GGO87798.1 exopolyphosphatase [Marinobacterium nitratireducens]